MELLRLRQEKNLTQRQVSHALGIYPQVYSRYERGEYEPSFEILYKLADFFGVTIDELLGRTSEPALFDNARVDRPEILELYDELTPAQQENLLNYARGMAVANELDSKSTTTKQKRA